MASIAEDFKTQLMAGLDKEIAIFDQKIEEFTKESTATLSKCEQYRDDIRSFEAEISKLLETKKHADVDENDDGLFTSNICPENPKSIHELYEEMDLLDISSGDDVNDDKDSGNEDGVEGDDDDEIICLGETKGDSAMKKRKGNHLTPPDQRRQVGQNGPQAKAGSKQIQQSPSAIMQKVQQSKASSQPLRIPQQAPVGQTKGQVTPGKPIGASSGQLGRTGTGQVRTTVATTSGQVGGTGTSAGQPVRTTVTGGQHTPVKIVVTSSAHVATTAGPVSGQITTGASGNQLGQVTLAPGKVGLVTGQVGGQVVGQVAGQVGGQPMVQGLPVFVNQATGPIVQQHPQMFLVQQGQTIKKVIVIQQQKPAVTVTAAPQVGSSPTKSAQPIKPPVTPQQANQQRQQPQPQPPRKTPATSEVVEIIDDDDDDDVVAVSNSRATARKSTTAKPQGKKIKDMLQASKQTPGPLTASVSSPPHHLDPSLMDGEDMFVEDDATLPELVQGKRVLAKSKTSFWLPAILTGPAILHKDKKKYKVQFEDDQRRLLTSKDLAVISPSRPGDLAVGIRVVASYIVDDGTKTKGLYAGIIAEVPMKTNKGRYLIFFDDGFAQYLSCDKIHIVYQSSAFVWADVDPASRDFIRDYLDKYPDRPMVNLKTGQTVMTEWHGKWWNATVLEVQGSLAHMLFEATATRPEEFEWIYRGSTRIKPLHELGNLKNMGVGTGPTPEQIRLNQPYVELTKVHSDHILPEQQIPQPKPTMLGRLNDPNLSASSTLFQFSDLLKQCAQQQAVDEKDQRRSSESHDDSRERKRSKRKKKKNKHKEPKDDYREDKAFEPTRPISLTQLIKVERKKFTPHLCNRECITGSVPKDVVNSLLNQNPMLWPMLLGWVRELCKQGGSSYKRYVIYRTPCGRSLCSFEDITRYLRETRETILSVERFSFDPFVHISINQRRTRQNSRFYYMQQHDLSKGIERVPISCVNEYDTDEPPPLKYMTERQGVQGSKINRDPNFLICCDCTNNCADNKTCACRQLTVEATMANREGKPKQDAGYKNRLLFDSLQTGIYECNDRCKCSRQCHNKVVQNGLSLRLQCFKTLDRGWGIRCLDDIPKGMFVCTYTGQVWSEEEADEKGKEHGDEYFAELDLIEVVEKAKEGYESDVDPIDEDLSEKDSDNESTNGRTQSSSDENESQTAQSEISSDDSADIVEAVYRRPSETKKPSTPTEASSVGTKLVLLRRQSDNTETKEWSVSAGRSKSESGTPTANDGSSPMKYGYDPNPSKKFLDQKQLDAFRERKQAEKAARQQLQSTSPESKAESKPTKDTQEDKKDIDAKISDLKLTERTEESNKPDEDDDEKKPKTRIVQGPRARKSTTGRRRHLGTSPGTGAEKDQDEEKDKKKEYVSIRVLFGEKENDCYVMDAKHMGNLGRYLNHSCRPNLFVQNVFVDTHDLRFPWIAFFAKQYIRAGQELTWDYNYNVGSVPGKEIKCLCKNPECRGRLL